MISCKDITERVRKTKLLKEANERYNYVKNATQDVIWDYNFEEETLFWDDKYQQLYGHERIDHTLKNWGNNIHPEDRKKVLISFDKATQDGSQRWSHTYRYKKADGSYAFVHNQAIFIRDENQLPIRAIGSLRDISSSKLKESELTRLKISMDHISDAILITEAEPLDHPGPQIVYANQAFYDHSGYTPEEIIGNTPRVLQGDKTSKKELSRLRKALEERKPCTVEVINYKKNGEPFCNEITIDPVIDSEGKCTHFTSIQRDITQIKEKSSVEDLYKKLSLGINKHDTLKSRYEFIIKNVAKSTHFQGAEGWITNANNTHLLKASTYCSSKKYKLFFQDTKFFQTKEDVGLPGKVWKHKKLIYFENIDKHKEFIRTDLAKKAGYRSAIGIPILTNNNQVNGVVLFFSNKKTLNLSRKTSMILNLLSKRFGAELSRMKTEDELNAFFEITPDAMCTMTPEGYFMKVNNAMANMTGYTKEELTSRHALEFVHPDDRQAVLNETLEVLKGKTYISEFFTCRYISKEGKTINTAWTSIYNREQKLIYLVAKNITDIATLESQIKKSKDIQHHIINSTEDYIWAIDRQYRLILANDAYLSDMNKITGKKYNIGDRVLSVTNKKWNIEEKVKSMWRENYDKAMKGEAVNFIFDIRDKNNNTTY
ncbi:MAG: PAS domain S-box protein, partial [Fulvivirga sp.]|nr:PAS domain S-box protein [Fulvivirga sp.]